MFWGNDCYSFPGSCSALRFRLAALWLSGRRSSSSWFTWSFKAAEHEGRERSARSPVAAQAENSSRFIHL